MTSFRNSNFTSTNRQYFRQALTSTEKYMHLLTEASKGIYLQIRETLKKEYIRELRMKLKSELNTDHKITATAALAVPVS